MGFALAAISWGSVVIGFTIGGLVFGFLGLIIGSLCTDSANRRRVPSRSVSYDVNDYATTIGADIYTTPGDDDWWIHV